MGHLNYFLSQRPKIISNQLSGAYPTLNTLQLMVYNTTIRALKIQKWNKTKNTQKKRGKVFCGRTADQSYAHGILFSSA
jgi:hypothetical protein